MTREEAIKVLNGIRHLNYRNFWDEECDEAIDIAIKALSEDKTDRMTREEAIADIKNNIKPVVGGKSLDMAIEALQIDTTQGVGRYENAMQKLRGMPRYLNNVKAKQIKKISIDAIQGKWIKHEGKWVDFDFYPTKYECNQCHYCVDEGYDSIFCPNCGARMKSE